MYKNHCLGNQLSLKSAQIADILTDRVENSVHLYYNSKNYFNEARNRGKP